MSMTKLYVSISILTVVWPIRYTLWVIIFASMNRTFINVRPFRTRPLQHKRAPYISHSNNIIILACSFFLVIQWIILYWPNIGSAEDLAIASWSIVLVATELQNTWYTDLWNTQATTTNIEIINPNTQSSSGWITNIEPSNNINIQTWDIQSWSIQNIVSSSWVSLSWVDQIIQSWEYATWNINTVVYQSWSILSWNSASWLQISWEVSNVWSWYSWVISWVISTWNNISWRIWLDIVSWITSSWAISSWFTWIALTWFTWNIISWSDILIITHPQDMMMYYAQWLIIASGNSRVTLLHDFEYRQDDISVSLPSWLQISTALWEPFDIASFGIQDASETSTWNKFMFWVDHQNLLFSQPIKISVPVTEPDGIVLNALVKHKWDSDYNTRWLTTDPTATCNSWDVSIGWTSVIVQSWLWVFYTCGASSFILNAWWAWGLRLWLKADSLAWADWSAVATWPNSQWWTAATQATAARRPILRKKTATNLIDNINFNPTVQFDWANDFLSTTSLFWNASWWDLHVYIVETVDVLWNMNFYEDVATPQWCPRVGAHVPVWWSIFRDPGDCSTSRISIPWSQSVQVPYLRSFSKSTTNTPAWNRSNIRNNWNQLISSNTTAQMVWSNSRFFIGADAGGNTNLNGKIAEMIVYAWNGGTINAATQNQIESYLATKYWITLNQTTPQNYTFSNWTTSRSASAWWIYNKNIAWISQDAWYSLNQTKSQSIENTWDIIISWVPANFRSMMRWNDAGAMTMQWSDIPSVVSQRLSRVRKMQEINGDIWTVTISIPTSSIPSSTALLLISNTSSFAGATSVQWVINWSNRDFVTNISNNQFITFWAPRSFAQDVCEWSRTIDNAQQWQIWGL